MAVSKQRIQGAEDLLTMTVAGTSDVLKIGYRPQAFTPQASRKAADAGGDAVFDFLLSVITSWDLTERDPTDAEPNPPVAPISKETLDTLGWGILTRMLREMAEAIRASH
jgi:hypothetical protein